MSREGDRQGRVDGGDDDLAIRVRGIYATALTDLLRDDFAVVQASAPIRDRFNDPFPARPADAAIETTDDRQGVGVVGDREAVAGVTDHLHDVSRDTFTWLAVAPRGAVFQGVVTDTLGGGAVVDLGDGEGFLPYDHTEDYVDEGDIRSVQVAAPEPPWSDDRPLLDTDLCVEGGLVTLTRRATSENGEIARLAELLPVDPPTGWSPDWAPAADEADLDALADALAQVGERAEELMAAIGDTDADETPVRLYEGEVIEWVWFGREARFALDGCRRDVTPTMPGHHRVKAAHPGASAAVDLVEAVCPDSGGEDAGYDDLGFPFEAVASQFGPQEGDRVALAHGKPDGRLLVLGRAEVTDREADGTVTLRREMHPGGTYDALGVERREGDVAVTKVREGRWWYPTVYRGADGQRRGTYVNVCTSVEVFPDSVRYVDLHVDVVKHADGTVERVDDDELDAAVESGHLREELASKARAVASTIEEAL